MVGILWQQESEIVADDKERAELLDFYYSLVFSCKGNGIQHGKTRIYDDGWPKISI